MLIMSADEAGVISIAHNFAGVVTPEALEGVDVGGQTNEVRASSTSNELGRHDLCLGQPWTRNSNGWAMTHRR
jgi:hypothetical protein